MNATAQPKVTWTNELGTKLVLCVHGESHNPGGEVCWVVSKVEHSPYVFLVPKAFCEKAA